MAAIAGVWGTRPPRACHVALVEVWRREWGGKQLPAAPRAAPASGLPRIVLPGDQLRLGPKSRGTNPQSGRHTVPWPETEIESAQTENPSETARASPARTDRHGPSRSSCMSLNSLQSAPGREGRRRIPAPECPAGLLCRALPPGLVSTGPVQGRLLARPGTAFDFCGHSAV